MESRQEALKRIMCTAEIDRLPKTKKMPISNIIFSIVLVKLVGKRAEVKGIITGKERPKLSSLVKI